MFKGIGKSNLDGYVIQNPTKICCNSTTNAIILWKDIKNNRTIQNSLYTKLTNSKFNNYRKSCLKIADFVYFSEASTFMCFTKDSKFVFDKVKSLFNFFFI